MASRVMEARAEITAQDKTGATFAKVAAKVRSLESATARVNSRASASASRIAATGGAMLATLGRFAAPAAIVAGTLAATKSFASFDRQLTYLGNTAEASGAQMAAIKKEIEDTARVVADSPENVLKATNAYVTAGQSLETAAKATRETAITAKAFGADIEEVAQGGTAVIQKMAIPVENLGRAFDMMAEGAKLGQFEAKDMAKELPSILSAAEALGEKGEKSLARIIASLEVARSATGDSSTAANDYYNLLQKIIAPETLKNFKKAGVDLEGELKKSVKTGEGMVDAFLRIAQRTSKGDPFKLKSLVGDMQANRALSVLLQNMGDLDEKTKRVYSASGARAQAFSNVMSDQQAPLDRLSSSWDRFVKSVGSFAAIPLAPTFDALADGIEKTQSLLTSPEARQQAAAEKKQSDAEWWARANLAEAQGREGLQAKGDKRRIGEIDEKVAGIRAGPLLRFKNTTWHGPNAMEQRRIDALLAERDKLSGGGSDELRARRLRRFEMEQALENLTREPPPDLNIPVSPGGYFPRRAADLGDWLQERDRRGPPPLPPAHPLRGRVSLPGVGDDAGGLGGAVKAVVQGPVTATVTGEAQIKVEVEVSASPELKALARAANQALQLRSAPTGRSMPEAEPSSGTSSGP